MDDGFKPLPNAYVADERDADLQRRRLELGLVMDAQRRRMEALGPLGLPFEQFEFMGVNFVAPDADTRFFHTLKSSDPGRVFYIPVMKSCDCTIYDRRVDATAPAWTHDSIVLRSNVAPAFAVLLLVVARENVPDPDTLRLQLQSGF